MRRNKGQNEPAIVRILRKKVDEVRDQLIQTQIEKSFIEAATTEREDIFSNDEFGAILPLLTKTEEQLLFRLKFYKDKRDENIEKHELKKFKKELRKYPEKIVVKNLPVE